MSSPTLSQLLTRLSAGDSTLAEVCDHTKTLIQREPTAADACATLIRTQHASGQLPRAHADALLAVLEPAANATDLHALPAQGLDVTGAQVKTEVIASRRAQTLSASDVLATGDLRPGCVINNRFVLDQQIGKGGMGVVFAAIDRRKQEARDPNPRVALKVLSADFQRHPQAFMALQREARKAQSLAHPNVVTVFDFDRDGDVVYMTMELLHGRPLHALIKEVRDVGVPAKIALPIIRGIAEGLAYAHRKGIVHSDLKPGNVFITDDGTPKILDFGIARAVPSSAADDENDEFDAGSLGAYTEAYATDEMMDGRDPHPADDMYALGIIAYELLCGSHPYLRHSAPSARELGIRPDALRKLKRNEARAIASCLSFQRERRPRDASEFLKLFRGSSRLLQASIAAILVLLIAAGWLSYQNYLETGPAMPLSALSEQQQAVFREKMQQGEEEWAFFERDGIGVALMSAIDLYAEAYRIHPRNREAVAALNRSASALLASAQDEAQRRAFARDLQARSEHFRAYDPVVRAAR